MEARFGDLAQRRAREHLVFGRLGHVRSHSQGLEGRVARHLVGVVDPGEHDLHLVLDGGDERGEDVARGAQLLDLNLQRLALHRQVVQDRLASVVGLLDDGAALLAGTFDERLAIHLGRLDQTFRGQSGVVIDLRGGALGLGDQRRGPFLGLDEMGRTALLALGEDLGAAFLGFSRHSGGLFVGRAQNRGTLGPQRPGQRGLVEGRIGRSALGLTQLILELSDARFEMPHLARDRLQLDTDLVGVVAPFSKGREVHSGNLGRRLARG